MGSQKMFLLPVFMFVCASIALALPGRPLSNSEMRMIRGMDVFSDCCAEESKKDCNHDDECIYCDHKTSSDTQCQTSKLDDPPPCINDGKNYAEADYSKCKKADTVNSKECTGNGTMTCWTEYDCTDSGVQNDKCCKDYDCVTMNETNCAGVNCAKCRKCTESSSTTGNKDTVQKQQCT